MRTVRLPGGRTYVHRCTQEVFEQVAYAVDCQGGVTLAALAERLDAPCTQVNVALELLKERGVVEVRLRRSHPASSFAFEDAMIEWSCLADATPDTPPPPETPERAAP